MKSHIKIRASIGSSSHMIGGLCSLTLSYITFLWSTRNFFCIHKNLALRLYNAAASSASRLRSADSLAITVGWGVGRIFTQVQCLKFTRSHFSVNAKKVCEKSSVAVQIDARIQSSSFTSRFFDQSLSRLQCRNLHSRL